MHAFFVSAARLFRPFRFLKRLLPQSLFGRSLIILLTPLILVQVILGYVFFDRHTETILRTLSESIAGNISLVMQWHESPQTPFEEVRALARRNMSLEVSFHEGEKLERTGQYRESWLYTPLITALNEKINAPYYVRISSDYIQFDIEAPTGVMHVELLRKRFFSRTTPLVIIWTTVSALFLFLVASLFMRNQIRPIGRLAEAADLFGRGEEHISFKPEGAFEVRKAGFAFLRMRERVKRLLIERLEMLAGVSHDLRTPITRLKLSLALMPEEARKAQIEADVNMLHQMVEGFLSYARGEADEAKSEIFLLAWIEALVAFHTKIPITVTGNNLIKIKIKNTAVNRCLTNIVVNSEKNANKLMIYVQQLEGMAVITCDDDGPGIPEAERENVFKPFYRLDQARNLDSVGVGLGLSVARDIVLTHGGSIDLMDSPLGGVRVVISLPI